MWFRSIKLWIIHHAHRLGSQRDSSIIKVRLRHAVKRGPSILIKELSSAKHQGILPARTANSVLCPRRVIILLSAATRYGARLVRGHPASGQRSIIWCAVFQSSKRIGSNDHGRWQGARIRRMHICMHGRLYALTRVTASMLCVYVRAVP